MKRVSRYTPARLGRFGFTDAEIVCLPPALLPQMDREIRRRHAQLMATLEDGIRVLASTHEAGGQRPASKPAPELSRLSGAGEISA